LDSASSIYILSTEQRGAIRLLDGRIRSVTPIACSFKVHSNQGTGTIGAIVVSHIRVNFHTQYKGIGKLASMR
jgi:hypothetical protein